MNNSLLIGTFWTLLFVIVEAIQFVYFGGLFQQVNSFLFGAVVFGIVTACFTGWAAIKSPDQLGAIFHQPGNLLALNLCSTAAWGSYLTAIEFIEPAIVYTISAGVMPIASLVANKIGLFGEQDEANNSRAGVLLLCVSIFYLAYVTINGDAGFVKESNSLHTGIAGVALAVADGIFFTLMLVFSQRIDRAGIGPSIVFGMRFPLYVLVAGTLAASTVSLKPDPDSLTFTIIIVLGLLLTVPHLYALQKAVASISTLRISVLTTTGPFVVFLLQMIEGRVAYSSHTLTGLCIYVAGVAVSLAGEIRNARVKSSTP